MEAIFSYIAGSLALSIAVTAFTAIGIVTFGIGIYKLFKRR